MDDVSKLIQDAGLIERSCEVVPAFQIGVTMPGCSKEVMIVYRKAEADEAGLIEARVRMAKLMLQAGSGTPINGN